MKAVNRSIAVFILLVAALVVQSRATTTVAAETDLDAFMQQVLARRDDNWKKLQQYILDEREQMGVRGPAHVSLWGEQRDFTWFIRDGYFVRSPLKANGVAISEGERRKYEADYLQRVQRRDRRGSTNRPAAAAENPATAEAPTDVASLIRQSRQPQFISSAYFLRFNFDAGTYALVGRERLEDQDVLRIEYYPTTLFSGRLGRAKGRDPHVKGDAEDQLTRLMDKVALVTLWVEPTAHQIVKFTYDNVSLDFLPAQWLAHVDDVKASMTMGQPFPGVWLPRALELNASLRLAIGQVDFRYALDYHDYRQAEVTTKVR